MSRLVWTHHALERQRAWSMTHRITREEVETVVENPHQVVDGYAGTRIAQSKRDDGLIRVVFVQDGEEKRILTVYWTSKIEKYWRS